MPETPIVEGATGTPAPPQGTPPAPSQDLILGRFKTPDELAKSYQELERKMTQDAQAKAALERQLQEQALREQARQTPPQPQENLNELFWQNPAEVQKKLLKEVVGEYLQPFEEDRYQMQKTKYATDPDFKRFEPQIDQMMSMQPELKRQPGSVDKMYRVLKAIEFDPTALEQQIRQKILSEQQNKVAGAVEGASPPVTGTPTNIQLTEQEMQAARKYYPELSPADAIKRYAESKVKYS